MNVLSRLLLIAYVHEAGGSGPATFARRIKLCGPECKDR